MREPELKAVNLVTAGHVHTLYLGHTNDGELDIAEGTVHGTHAYQVQITPEGSFCTCPYGINNPGRSHSHTIALSIQATMEGTT